MLRGRGTPLLKTSDLHLDVVLRRPKNAPPPSAEHVRQHLATSALVDTGASHCCIDISIANRLELVRSDQTQLGGIGGIVDANVYHCVVEVPRLNYAREMELFAPVDHSVPSMMLLGRSFMQDFVLVYEGPEHCFYFYRAGHDPHDDDDGYAT